jgi:hypothetical protein
VARSAYLKALAINSDDIVNNYQLGFAGLESSPVEPEGFRYVAKAIRLAKAHHDKAAAYGRNQNANLVDLVITMEEPLTDPPVTGTRVNVTGFFTGYQLNPFFFSMAQGRLATPASSKE